jgi:hypothetical protein
MQGGFHIHFKISVCVSGCMHMLKEWAKIHQALHYDTLVY